MPHLMGPAGNPLPPSRNEVLLREEVDRLRAQLDAARQVIALARRPPTFNTNTRAYVAALDAYDKLTEETTP
jgi:hypothetical protein